eukprot:4076264-Prymnesium_polylepis.1
MARENWVGLESNPEVLTQYAHKLGGAHAPSAQLVVCADDCLGSKPRGPCVYCPAPPLSSHSARRLGIFRHRGPRPRFSKNGPEALRRRHLPLPVQPMRGAEADARQPQRRAGAERVVHEAAGGQRVRRGRADAHSHEQPQTNQQRQGAPRPHPSPPLVLARTPLRDSRSSRLRRASWK